MTHSDNHATPQSERWQRAIGFKIDGSYDEALAELTEIVRESPDDPEVHHQIGLILGFTGRFDQSLSALNHAVALAPDNTLIRNDLALTHTMLGQYDEAREQFALVLEHDRENQIALRNLTYF